MLIMVTEPCGCLPWGRHDDNCPGKLRERELERAIERMLAKFRQVLKRW